MTKYDPGTYQIMNILSIHKKADKNKVDEEKVISRMYAVCGKYGKSLDEITRKEITKTEYKYLMNFINLRGCIGYANLD